MRWSLVWPLLYLALCLYAGLRALFSTGPAPERWLLLQGLTLPWGVGLSYLPQFARWPESAYAASFSVASLLNAGLLSLTLRALGHLANLADPGPEIDPLPPVASAPVRPAPLPPLAAHPSPAAGPGDRQR